MPDGEEPLSADEQALMPISATRREVAEQPEVVARVLERLAGPVAELARTLAGRGVERLLAAGSGDSWFAAQAVGLAFERYAGLPWEARQAYELAAHGRAGLDQATAIFVVSSSGRPTTTWDALDRALASPAYVVGVTDDPRADNPFVARPPAALVPGAVKAGWPTQTTTATIAVLLDLAIALGRIRGTVTEARAMELASALRGLPRAMASVLEASRPWAERLAGSLAGRRLWYLVGGGPGHAVAQVGSALLAEGPQAIGLAFPVEEFHHGLRVAALEAGDPVVLLAPSGAAAGRARDTARSVRAWGARLLTIADEGTGDLVEDQDGLVLPVTDEPLSPLLLLLPLHVLSVELALRRVAAGHRRPASVP